MLKTELKELDVENTDKQKIKQFSVYFDLEWMSKPLQQWNFYKQSVRQTTHVKQSRRIVKLRERVKVKPTSRIYRQVNERLNELWDRYEKRTKKSRESIDILAEDSQAEKEAANRRSALKGDRFICFIGGDSQGFGIELRKHDLDKLKPGEWINDNIFHYYLNLIVHRSQQDPSIPKVVSMSTFFYNTLFLKASSCLKVGVQSRSVSADLVLTLSKSCSLVPAVSCTLCNRSDQLLRLTTCDGRDCTQRLREYFDFEAKQRKVDAEPLTWADSTSNK
uniref:Uncharacterized protein n=1 Tax=Ditylenchus dipsaci TaxID=166011 RepID=A0A915ER42_9BILA